MIWMGADVSKKVQFQTGHVGLNVADLERSKKFYQEVFGFAVIAESNVEGKEYAFLGDDGKLVLTLWQQSEGEFATNRPGLHHLSFQVETIESVKTVEANLKAIGARFAYDGVVPHQEGSQSGGIFFFDPDGIRLEIFSPTGAEHDHAPVEDAPSCGFF
jgi:lactoylglutathione lyase